MHPKILPQKRSRTKFSDKAPDGSQEPYFRGNTPRIEGTSSSKINEKKKEKRRKKELEISLPY